MKSFNHMYGIAFTVKGSTHIEGEDITPAQFRAAVINRLDQLALDPEEWREAVGAPEDTFEEEPPLLDFTVIGFREETGQVWYHNVKAQCSGSAFTAAAKDNEHMTFVVALPGIHSEESSLCFPGSAVVDACTVLEQPEVFGCSDLASDDDNQEESNA